MDFKKIAFDKMNPNHLNLLEEATMFGYIPLGEMVEINNEECLLVNLSKKNNGVYAVSPKDMRILYVIEPNTADNSKEVSERIGQITNQLAKLDWSEFEPYDIVEIFTGMIDNLVVTSYADRYYNSQEPRHRAYREHMADLFFRNLYTFRTGNELSSEEEINSQPYQLYLAFEKKWKGDSEDAEMDKESEREG